MDCFSLLFTQYSLRNIVEVKKSKNHTLRHDVGWVLTDSAVAITCFIITQTLTNGVYALQLNKPDQFLEYMFDYSIPFKLFALNLQNYPNTFMFSGTILISLTSYLPTLLMLSWTFFFVFHRHLTTATAKIHDRLIPDYKSNSIKFTPGLLYSVVALVITIIGTLTGIIAVFHSILS